MIVDVTSRFEIEINVAGRECPPPIVFLRDPVRTAGALRLPSGQALQSFASLRFVREDRGCGGNASGRGAKVPPCSLGRAGTADRLRVGKLISHVD
jgi:hypothetical protein